MKLSPAQKKILKAIPEAQARLDLEYVSSGFLKPHMGRLPNPDSIRKMVNEGILILNPENPRQFKIA